MRKVSNRQRQRRRTKRRCLHRTKNRRTNHRSARCPGSFYRSARCPGTNHRSARCPGTNHRSARCPGRRKTYIGGIGVPKYSIMSYNVLARGATAHQEDRHKFVFQNNTLPLSGAKPAQIEHIEQTLDRFKKIVDEIATQNPDIVLLQEVDNYFYAYLTKHLPAYAGYFKLFIPSARGDLSANFATAVVWKREIFELLDVAAAHTLDSESYYATRDYPVRIASPFQNKNATMVTLKEIASPEDTICVASMHLAGDVSKQNAAISAKKDLVAYVLDEFGKSPARYKVFGGDLNCPVFEESCPAASAATPAVATPAVIECCYKWITNVTKARGFQKVNQEESRQITTCDFDYSQLPHDQTTIDSIFYNSEAFQGDTYSVQQMTCPPSASSVYKSASTGVDTSYADIEYGSDHAWIMAHLVKKG